MAEETLHFHLARDIYAPVEVQIQSLVIDPGAAEWSMTDASLTLRDALCMHGSNASVYASLWLRDEFGPVGTPLHTTCVESINNERLVDDGAQIWCYWGQMVTFPVRYRDLDQSTRLCITVWYSDGLGSDFCVLGGCVMPFFSQKGRLKTDAMKLGLSLGREADDIGRSTMYKYSYNDMVSCAKNAMKISGAHAHGNRLDLVDELDRLVKAQKRFARGDYERLPWLDSMSIKSTDERISSIRSLCGLRRGLELKVNLPKFDFDVLYCDVYASHHDGPHQHHGTLHGNDGGKRVLYFSDPEIDRDSPAEVMAQKLARSAARGNDNPTLRPNTQEKAELERIIRYSPTKILTREEKELIWRYRYALTHEGKALTKFLKCVDWADAEEAAQASKLMRQWAGIDVGDALEMLSPVFPIEAVRSHAVEFLRILPDENIHLILLQLVQALRYEERDVSPLSKFLLEKSGVNELIASSLFWYLCSELEDTEFGKRAQVLQTALLSALCDSESQRHDIGGPRNKVRKASIPLQLNLVARLRHLFDSIKLFRSADAKTEQIRTMLRLGGSCEDLAHFMTPSPLNPSIRLSGVIADACLVFKSKVNPVKLVWNVHGRYESETPYAFIYKKGDDLRQDQLVLQIFSLMDRLLKREHVDLQITPYRVLPTSIDDGLIEFVPKSVPLSAILREYGSVQQFLEHHAPSKSPRGIRQQVLHSYTRSCAGYTVFTHILGIGDRHNDNVMITTEGKLFHIDFGYILGRDPKFSSAPLFLNRSIVDGMGGPESPEYEQFVQLSCEALNILRKSSNLLLSLIHVMAQSSVPDIRTDPEMAMLKVQEKLLLDMSDEQAAAAFVEILNAAQTAVLPRIAEVQHRVAQGWR